LKQVQILLRQEGWKVVNIDAVIMAQKPKMMPHIPDMVNHISNALGIDKLCINIKATTTEGLGFVGREEGIAAQAVVLIKPQPHQG
jgi:2-C-methyl-D-erythritol 2,4-cyclodiphosphate synthase